MTATWKMVRISMLNDIKDYTVILNAVTEEDIDAVKLCAASIKYYNKDLRSMLVTNKFLAEQTFDCIDTVKAFPYENSMSRDTSVWQNYWAADTRFNLVMNPYMICHTNLTTVFDYLFDHHTIAVTNSVNDYRGTPITHMDRLYESESLDRVCSDVLYFELDSDISVAYFKMLDIFTHAWREVYEKFIEDAALVPKEFDLDLISSLVLDNISLKDDLLLQDDIFNIVDLKRLTTDSGDNIIDSINIWRNSNKFIKLQNYRFETLLAYGNKPLNDHTSVMTDYINAAQRN